MRATGVACGSFLFFSMMISGGAKAPKDKEPEPDYAECAVFDEAHDLAYARAEQIREKEKLKVGSPGINLFHYQADYFRRYKEDCEGTVERRAKQCAPECRRVCRESAPTFGAK